MLLTKAFKSADGQAVRIPAELAYADLSLDLNIGRVGDVIMIFPTPRHLSDAAAILRDLPKPADIEPREPIDLPERARD